MTTVTIPKKVALRLVSQKNWRVWQKLAGAWRHKRLVDPVAWQRKLRSEPRR